MLRLSVPDMSCGHCKAAIEGAVRAVEPAAEVAVDLPARRVTIANARDPGRLRAAMAAEGYPSQVLSEG